MLLANEGGASECLRVSSLLRQKLSELDKRLKLLRGFRSLLAHYLAECDEEIHLKGEQARCPVFEEIANLKKKIQRKGKNESRKIIYDRLCVHHFCS
jgi:hypothetical protein